jgi:hypothetical protein
LVNFFESENIQDKEIQVSDELNPALLQDKANAKRTIIAFAKT